MKQLLFKGHLLVALLILMVGCTSYQTKDFQSLYGDSKPSSHQVTKVAAGNVSYLNDVKPIVDARCVACHACYDAPCQLKLSSFEGLERGASKQAIYDGSRLGAVSPTRLFIDASSTQAWRDKQFFPIINERQQSAVAGIDNSILARLLLQKRRHPQPATGKLVGKYNFDLDDKYQCPRIDEHVKFADKYPQWGMPYAMPGLSLAQENTMLTWLEQGAKNDQQLQLSVIAKQELIKWESFFNRRSLKQQLVSRYIYEHLFIGHIHFKGQPDNEFYKLVRSKTPTGQAIAEIKSVRPYDDPQVATFYYRLRPVVSTIVDKTHFVYELGDKRRLRYQQLFFANKFRVTELPSYEPEAGANPFKTFVDIPNIVKYQFLLDDAQYFVSGFIKGPVCRGQLALNVIQDHFWVLFLNPTHKYQAAIKQSLAKYNDILFLPAKEGDQIGLLGWQTYNKLGKEYLYKKSAFIQETMQPRGGLSLNNIWNGDNRNQNAALTVFRHYDSATVEQGLIGTLPKTAWVVDYPLFERIHYLLVADFNVFGSAGHQLASRTYMDFLRRDGENNLLRFLPATAREQIYNTWYQGIVDGRMDPVLLNLDFASKMQFSSQNYYADFFQQVKPHLGKALKPDRWAGRVCEQEACAQTNVDRVDKMLRQLDGLTGIEGAAIPEIAFLRVNMLNGQDRAYTLLHNKALTNVAYIFAESYRRTPAQDTLTVVPGFIGSYPNFFFTVAEQDLGQFIAEFKNAQTAKSKTAFYARYGVRRTNPEIWPTLDWFNTEHKKSRGLNAGLFDMNRYHNL
ncbi:MAG: hypothetical protein methR_P3788 [Methyloprofundus sp.]|nr:MAG: hypothetical protein methR_P3788 [Methyloprofundus sp.]